METTINPSLKSVYALLRYTFAIVPIVAGLDKFTNILTQWDHYLNPVLTGMLPFSGHTFMYIVGIIEILAGVLVLIRPVAGTLIVSAWLVLIALSLITAGNYLDVAVRDLVMAISAFSTSRLARIIE